MEVYKADMYIVDIHTCTYVPELVFQSIYYAYGSRLLRGFAIHNCHVMPKSATLEGLNYSYSSGQ